MGVSLGVGGGGSVGDVGVKAGDEVLPGVGVATALADGADGVGLAAPPAQAPDKMTPIMAATVRRFMFFTQTSLLTRNTDDAEYRSAVRIGP